MHLHYSVQDYCRTLVADIANTRLYQLEGGVFNLPCITVVYTQQCHIMVLHARQRAPTLVDDRAAQALEQAAHMQPSSGTCVMCNKPHIDLARLFIALHPFLSGPSGPPASAVGGETEKEESRSIHLSGDPEDNTQMLFEVGYLIGSVFLLRLIWTYSFFLDHSWAHQAHDEGTHSSASGIHHDKRLLFVDVLDMVQQQVWTWDIVKDMPDNVYKWLPTLGGGVCIYVAELKRIHSEKDSTASYLSSAAWTVVARLLQVRFFHYTCFTAY
eukprot:1160334-Pelagomonas_calceolata.AAC.3